MVRQETSGQQVPWVLASVEGEFMFSLPPRVATSPAAPSPRESLSEEGARLDQERRRLENERKRLDEERTRVAAAPRVGVLDVELVLARSAAGISARETLERETSEFRRIMDFKRDELQKLRDELEKKGPLMTGDVRQEKIAVFERKRKEAAQLADDFQKELAKHEQAFLKQVLTGIGEAVKDLGVEQGYEAIVEKGTSKPMYTRTSTTVIGTTQGVDVTPDVIHRFDERTRRSAR
jgi:outer membrane protein